MTKIEFKGLNLLPNRHNLCDKPLGAERLGLVVETAQDRRPNDAAGGRGAAKICPFVVDGPCT